MGQKGLSKRLQWWKLAPCGIPSVGLHLIFFYESVGLHLQVLVGQHSWLIIGADLKILKIYQYILLIDSCTFESLIEQCCKSAGGIPASCAWSPVVSVTLVFFRDCLGWIAGCARQYFYFARPRGLGLREPTHIKRVVIQMGTRATRKEQRT